MAANPHYFRIGIFILAAFALGLAGMLLLGSRELSQASVELETYVDESVQGLEVGSPVKLRGVKIGQVEKILFVDDIYPTSKHYILIRVTLLSRVSTPVLERQMHEQLQQEIAGGLRVRLASQGLTGTAYLEADYLDPRRFPPLPVDWEPACIYVPSAPSVITQLGDAIQHILGKLENTKIEKISDNLDILITSLNSLVVDDLKPAIHNIDGVSAGLALTMQELGSNVNYALSHKVNPVMAHVQETAARLPAAVTQLQATLTEAQRLVADQQAGLDETMDNLRGASRNLRQLTDDAQRYPSRVLFGQPPRPVEVREP